MQRGVCASRILCAVPAPVRAANDLPQGREPARRPNLLSLPGGKALLGASKPRAALRWRDSQGVTMSKLGLLVLVAMFGLTGCAVEFENPQAARELADLAKPPGSVYTGWRVYQDKCAGCHGAEASGSVSAPDLLLRVRDLGPQRFVSLVLQRYDWGLPATQAKPQTPARAALIEDILQRKDAPIAMPAWGDEPRVSAHILDVYAYLSARSEGTQGLGRPAP